MEIEAKFNVPDTQIFEELKDCTTFAQFDLAPGQVKSVRDTYLDTPSKALLAAGYACRARAYDDHTDITLKGLGQAEDAVHRREEIETRLDATAEPKQPGQWPESEVRSRVQALIGETPLQPLFSLTQTRTTRMVTRDEQAVAELSLDAVRLAGQDAEQAYLELEVELLPEISEDVLTTIVAYIQETWALPPEPRSKFERGLAFVQQTQNDESESLLTPEEQRQLRPLAQREDTYGRRARGLLALNQGLTQKEAGERADLAARTVRHWLAEFRKHRLGIFPPDVLSPPHPTQDSLLDTDTTSPPPDSSESPSVAPWPLETLLEHGEATDLSHAQAVITNAHALFEALAPIHQLPPDQSALLDPLAYAREVDPNLLKQHPPAELEDEDRSILNLIVTLPHNTPMTRKRMKKLRKTALYTQMPPDQRHNALTLAALLRCADGLDAARSGQTGLIDCTLDEAPSKIVCHVEGSTAAQDARQATKQSALWRRVFKSKLRFTLPPAPLSERLTQLLTLSSEAGTQPALMLPEAPDLRPDDAMAEAARKTLLFHFQKMLFHEPGTRLGEDIEELHDMRVATRRMRSAVRVFEPYLDMDTLRRYVKGIRRTRRVLGAVRDLDVFWEKTQQHLDTYAEAQRPDLQPLQEAWQAERTRTREKMETYLDSPRYLKFKKTFAEFLQTSDMDADPTHLKKDTPIPYQVRHVVPIVIYQRLAAVRAYDDWIHQSDTPLTYYHHLRIAAKRLRYALEFFQEVLGDEVTDIIKTIKGLQDHLGDLQDAVVASNLLRDFLVWGTWGTAHDQMDWPADPVIAPGVAAYMTARQIEIQQQLETFPSLWAHIQSRDFSEQIASVIATL